VPFQYLGTYPRTTCNASMVILNRRTSEAARLCTKLATSRADTVVGFVRMSVSQRFTRTAILRMPREANMGTRAQVGVRVSPRGVAGGERDWGPVPLQTRGCAWGAEGADRRPFVAHSCPRDPLCLCGSQHDRARIKPFPKPRVARSSRAGRIIKSKSLPKPSPPLVRDLSRLLKAGDFLACPGLITESAQGRWGISEATIVTVMKTCFGYNCISADTPGYRFR
jgi:hypothetical protein